MTVDIAALALTLKFVHCPQTSFLVAMQSRSFVTSAAFYDELSKGSCYLAYGAKKQKVTVAKKLRTPYLSFDHLAFRANDSVQGFASPLKEGERVVVASFASKVTLKPGKGAPMIVACDDARRGLERVRQLPAEERDTHPDQNYGFALWTKWCDLPSAKLDGGKEVGRTTIEKVKVVFREAVVLWSDDKSAFLNAEGLEEGALVFRGADLSFAAFATQSKPFGAKPQPQGPAIVRLWHKQSFKILEDAIRLGLWDY